MATDIRAGVTSLADSFQESESECGPTQAQWIAKSHGRHPKKTCFILPKNPKKCRVTRLAPRSLWSKSEPSQVETPGDVAGFSPTKGWDFQVQTPA